MGLCACCCLTPPCCVAGAGVAAAAEITLRHTADAHHKETFVLMASIGSFIMLLLASVMYLFMLGDCETSTPFLPNSGPCWDQTLRKHEDIGFICASGFGLGAPVIAFGIYHALWAQTDHEHLEVVGHPSHTGRPFTH